MELGDLRPVLEAAGVAGDPDAIAVLLLSIAAASPAAACRCAQLPVERYFEAAEIVLVGEAVRVTPRTVDGVDALEVEAEPRFHQGRRSSAG